MSANINSASLFFNENWKRYQLTIQNNTLYHREMLATLEKFLLNNVTDNAFSFVDVGCGDSSTVAPILMKFPIKNYYGIDAAPDVLKLAEQNLTSLKCQKEFIAENMLTAIPKLATTVDIIYTSYAVHHLMTQQKVDFIQACQQKLNPNGFLLMVDGVLEPNQTRKQWLHALHDRITQTQHELTANEVAEFMEHPKKDDFPDSIATFSDIAKQQNWKDFQVLFNANIFGFMAFLK